MKDLQTNDFVNDFKIKENKFSYFSFYFFQNGAKNKKECLKLNLTESVNNFYPNTINLIIDWYLKKDVDEVDVEFIENEIQNRFLEEMKKKSHF